MPTASSLLSLFRKFQRDRRSRLKSIDQLDDASSTIELPMTFREKDVQQICDEPEGIISVARLSKVPPLGAVVVGYVYLDSSIAAYIYELPSQKEKKGEQS